MHSVWKAYESSLLDGHVIPDDQQRQIIQKLDVLSDALCSNKKSWFRSASNMRGLYIYGKVGVGKTFMMDLFFNNTEIEDKWRIHFHAFMQEIHDELRKLEGKRDPLKILAKKIRQKAQLICFDEFAVSDITDAMLLSGLFEALFKQGIVLVATSNVPPEKLYENGIQRERFLPFIDLLFERTEVIGMKTTRDYRLREMLQKGNYFHPLNHESDSQMHAFFDALQETPKGGKSIQVLSRIIPIILHTDKVLWVDFDDLCSPPRGKHDYLELVKTYRIFMLSNIPKITAQQTDKVCNFIHLIDVLYDNRCQLIVSAQEPPEMLYQEGRMIFEYARTHSRLIEMQTEDYFNEAESNDASSD